jgi:excisionase family DNA binding protein
MSSNIRIQKVCMHCGEDFTAKTTTTQFCSDDCAKRNYKQRKRDEKLEAAKQFTRQTKTERILNPLSKIDNIKKLVSTNFSAPTVSGILKELVDTQELAIIVGLSERTLNRLMKDKKFPRLRVGKRVLFQKDKVLEYLNHKFSNV